jgi:hypothetical protein
LEVSQAGRLPEAALSAGGDASEPEAPSACDDGDDVAAEKVKFSDRLPSFFAFSQRSAGADCVRTDHMSMYNPL